MRVLFVAAALLIVALPAAQSASGSAAATRISIAVWPDGRGDGKPVRHRTLKCQPARGSHPAPGLACRRLFANLKALRPVPASRVCADRNGGPGQAVLSGSIRGRPIRAVFNRRNGCEIERWNRLAPVFRAQDAATSLGVTVWLEGQAGETIHTSLTCEPSGGTHPSPAQACARLLAIEDPLGPLPWEMPCVLTSRGPQVAVVRGSYRGKPVETRFDRSDSCEARRWDRIAILFAAP